MVYPPWHIPFGCHLQHGRDTDNTIAITGRMSAATEMRGLMGVPGRERTQQSGSPYFSPCCAGFSIVRRTAAFVVGASVARYGSSVAAVS